jgi:arginyl-tRNA synthetase
MRQNLETAIAVAVETLFEVQVPIELTRPEEQFGDYTTNVALQLSTQLGKSPRDIGEVLATKLRTDLADQLVAVEVAGPGFINLKVTDANLRQAMRTQPTQSLTGQTILAEYSDPNPFKPLHAGHLYTTLVGDSVARLMEVAGAHVIRLNYRGDVGLHVGKSMWAISKKLGGERIEPLLAIPEHERSSWLGTRYVEGNDAYEEDATAKEEIIAANKRVYELHENNDHDSEFAQIYWTCRDWSYKYFNQLFDELAIKQFDRVIPESEIVPLGLSTVREQLTRGVYVESEGAVVFKGEAFGLHTRVFINSQGLPTYEAKDVGLLLTKWQDYHFDRSIVITANEQAQYMEVMLKSVEQFAPEPVRRSTHLTHGAVKLKGGVKMSSRTGHIVAALDILKAAAEANKQVTDRDNQEAILGAVKYAFLKTHIGGDIIYDPAESVSLEGNSGPYLQYAHARARSILTKAPSSMGETTDSLVGDERSLARKITEYPEVIQKAVSELMPHYVCTYLYELAQIFNRFYEHNRVVGDERSTLRLELVKCYANVLKDGLQLLGIAAPDHM